MTEPTTVKPDRVLALHLAGLAAILGSVTAVFYFRLARVFGSGEAMLLRATWDDGFDFYEIATKGYAGVPLATFREVGVYPWLVRPLAPLLGPHALLAVSLAFSIFATWVLYLVLRRFYLSPRAAFGCAAVLSVARNPLFFMGFVKWGVPSMTVCTALEGSEPVYLTFFLLAFYALKTDRYALAFFFMGLATNARVLGVIVTASFFLECLLRGKWKQSLWAALPALMLLAHFAWFWHVSGNFFALFDGHRAFNHTTGSSFTYPFHDLVQALRGNYRDTWETPWGWVLIYVYCVVGLVLLARRDRALFVVTAPLFLFFLCVKDWSLHGRYYDILIGVPIAYCLLLPSARARRHEARSPLPTLDGSPP